MKENAPIESGYTVRDCYETEREFIICGDPEEIDDHNCDEMGCSSVSHVIYRFAK